MRWLLILIFAATADTSRISKETQMRKLIWLFLFVPAMAFTQVSNPSAVESATDPTGVACTSAAPILRYTSGGTSTMFACTGSGGTVYAAIGTGVIIGSGSPISF